MAGKGRKRQQTVAAKAKRLLGTKSDKSRYVIDELEQDAHELETRGLHSPSLHGGGGGSAALLDFDLVEINQLIAQGGNAKVFETVSDFVRHSLGDSRPIQVYKGKLKGKDIAVKIVECVFLDDNTVSDYARYLDLSREPKKKGLTFTFQRSESVQSSPIVPLHRENGRLRHRSTLYLLSI